MNCKTIVIATVMTFVASAVSADQVAVPPVGTSFRYDCDSPWNSFYEYTVVEVKGGKVKFEQNRASAGSGYGVKDVWAWVTTIYDERKADNVKLRMTQVSGSLEEIGTLEVGEKVSAWYRQWHSEHGRNRWEYKLHTTEMKEVATKNFGKQMVYVVVEKRQSPEWYYGSEMITHYAPALSNITYWKYKDKEGTEECHLTEMK